ncbi:GlsB/YeaQ/YmgE family stress response membrane protein [Rothia sp. ARF10]|nr:GlsB/YeaQ/YmgE family stress response membrane protein [Rothia sp. ARF10]
MPGTLGIIGWIIIGGLAGWIASKIMKTDAQQGILLNIIVGIVGAFLGGLLLSLLGVDTDGAGIILTFITAIAGACLLLFGVKALTGGRSRV